MTSIRLKTRIPGPRSTELLARREAAVPRGPFNATPIFIEEGRGATLTDVDGNRLLDFAGGLGCLNVGHANEAVVKAASAQLERSTHSCFHVTPYGGSDPGISTVMSFRRRDRRGIVLMANTAVAHHAMDAIAWHYYTGESLA